MKQQKKDNTMLRFYIKKIMEQFCAMKSQTRDGVLLVPIYWFQKQKKFNQNYARGVLCLVSFF